MSIALCIIDMQLDFFETGEPALDKVLHQIKLAKRRKAPIVVVEYDECGSTLGPIRRALKGYPNVASCTKHSDGGGNVVARIMKKNKFGDRVRLVGVNTSYCVYSTAVELKNKLKHIEVSKTATNCYKHKSGLKKLKKAGLKLVA